MNSPNNYLSEKYSPRLHFRAPFGWINDPNGLVFVDGLWHLFYQFNPMSTVWGPMYWGHAVSQDLQNWSHMPIAMAPDLLGNIFSGSCVVDANDDSGIFGGPSERNLLAFFTSSLPQEDGKPDLQVQSLAYSKDGGFSWNKWSGNPVIGNPGLECFRDPKVFRWESGAHWVMVLTHGQSIGIYRSEDLLHWSLASEFGEGWGHHSQGPWECPDLFELTSTHGEKRWALVVGIGDGCPAAGSGTQYFLGRFDGSTFTNEGASDQVHWFDLGRDHYATQSWSTAPNQRRVAIAWMSNWRYARHTLTQFFRGVMTLPRDLHLGGSATQGFFLGQRFSCELDRAFGLPCGEIRAGQSRVAPEGFRLKGLLSFEVGDLLGICLFDEDHAQFVIRRGLQGYEIVHERRASEGDETFQREFPHLYTSVLQMNRPDLEVDMIVDAGAVELLLDGGRVSISQLFFPHAVAGLVRLNGSVSGALALTELVKESGHGQR